MVKISCCTIFFMISYEMLKKSFSSYQVVSRYNSIYDSVCDRKKRMQYQISKLIYILD